MHVERAYVLSKEGSRRCFILSSDKNEKDHNNLSKLNKSIIARNRKITKQRTLKHETNKTDRKPQTKTFWTRASKYLFPKRSAKMIDGTEKPKICKTHSAIQQISL